MTIAFKSTRASRRIDYSDPKVIAARAKRYQLTHALQDHGFWIVGKLIRVGDTLTLAAVPELPGRVLSDAANLTNETSKFYRWRTRQAARQWLVKRPHLQLALWNLDRLWDPRCPRDKSAAAPANAR